MLHDLDKNYFDYLEDDIRQHELLLSRLYLNIKGLSDRDYH